MSERLHSGWKKTTAEAFGADNILVQRGKQAEDEYFAWAKKMYDSVESHEEDREKQNAGIDFTIFKTKWKQPYTVEIKSNLRKRSFDIDNRNDGWLRSENKKSDRIVHVDLKGGWIADYRREEMIKFLDEIEAPRIKTLTYELFSDINPKKLVHMYNIRQVSVSDFIKRKKETDETLHSRENIS